MAIIANNAINQLKSSAGWVAHTHVVIRQALSISEKLSRGFEIKISSGGFDGVIKNSNYDDLVDSTISEIKTLGKQVHDNPRQIRKIEDLTILANRYFKAQRSRDLLDAEVAARDFKIDSLFHLNCQRKINEIIDLEQQKLAVREAENIKNERNTRGIIIISTALGILCLGQLFRYILKAFEENIRTQNLLKVSEATFAKSFKHASIGMAIVSSEGQWLDVNPALCQILGYQKDELSEHKFQEITHPDDLKQDLDVLEKAIRGEIDDCIIEKRYRHKDGHYIDASLNLAVVRDSSSIFFISQIQDISHIKKMISDLQEKNAEIQASQHQLRLFIETTPVAICMLDNDLNFIVASNKWRAAFSLTEEMITGKTFMKFFLTLMNAGGAITGGPCQEKLYQVLKRSTSAVLAKGFGLRSNFAPGTRMPEKLEA